MEDKTREHMIDGSIWKRGLHMLLFSVAYNVVEAMMALIAIFQFFCALITGGVNEPLLQFAKNASIYIQEVMEFLTFNSEIRPFPFTAWPDEAHTGEAWLDADDIDTTTVEELDDASVDETQKPD
ncbi:MAG: hypothetical protein ACJAX5_001913 [Patiriisocius sp.]|jgi:hypothetical protein